MYLRIFLEYIYPYLSKWPCYSFCSSCMFKQISLLLISFFSAELKNLKNDFTKILEKNMEKPTGMVESAECTVKDVGGQGVTNNLRHY